MCVGMGNGGTGCFNTGDGVTKGESAVQTRPCLSSACSVVTVIQATCVTTAEHARLCYSCRPIPLAGCSMSVMHLQHLS